MGRDLKRIGVELGTGHFSPGDQGADGKVTWGAHLLPAGGRSGGLLHMCSSLCRSPVRTIFLGSGAWVAVCIGTCAHVFICMWRAEGSLQELVPSFVGPRDHQAWQQVFLSREHLTSILVVVVVVLFLKQGFSV